MCSVFKIRKELIDILFPVCELAMKRNYKSPQTNTRRNTFHTSSYRLFCFFFK
ncbi:hypothetical protein Hanom_Chr00s080879g01793731 [Helianthus anomalus]